MRAVWIATCGVGCGLLGVITFGIGIWLIAFEPHPMILGGILFLVLGCVFFVDGQKKLHRDYPRARFRERVAALAEPVGLSVEQVRDELGVESFFRRREHGCELTWRVGSMELVLAFDSKRLCTGIVAARGLPIT